MLLLKLSQELDNLLNRYQRGEVSKEQLEEKRQELYQGLEGVEESA